MCQPFPEMSSILRVWTEGTAGIDNVGNHNSAGFLHRRHHRAYTLGPLESLLPSPRSHLLAPTPRSSHSHLPISDVLLLHSGEEERERICWENRFALCSWLAAAQALLLLIFADSMSADPFLVHHITPRRICKLTCVPSTQKMRLHLSNYPDIWSPVDTRKFEIIHIPLFHFKMLKNTSWIQVESFRRSDNFPVPSVHPLPAGDMICKIQIQTFCWNQNCRSCAFPCPPEHHPVNVRGPLNLSRDMLLTRSTPTQLVARSFGWKCTVSVNP